MIIKLSSKMAYLTLCDERDTGCEERNIDYIEHYMEDGTISQGRNLTPP